MASIPGYISIITDLILLNIGFLIILLFSHSVSYFEWFSCLLDSYSSVDLNRSFDFIIVGGGTAGAILAARLSENSNFSVLLLESGCRKPGFFNIPILGPVFQGTSLDWAYLTKSQTKSCSGLKNQQSRWPVGRALGGSTHLNYMIYMTGSIGDYVDWEDHQTGEFGPSEIRRIFNEIENGKEQVAPTRAPLFSTTLSDAILAAVQGMGFPLSDLGLDSTVGFTRPQLHMDEGGRRWTSDQYLDKFAGNRKNLVIRTGAMVKKILIDKNNSTYGVLADIGGTLIKILCTKEVILSAGAVGSAQLLMLSGIGPRQVLEDAQVDVIADLPVGQYLIDHVTTGLDLVLSDKPLFGLFDLLSLGSIWSYYVHGTGPWTASGCELIGFIPYDNKTKLEIMVLMGGLSTDNGIRNRFSIGITDDVWNSYFSLLMNESVATILPVVLQPQSTGTIILNPQNPEGPPVIDPNYFSNDEDLRQLVAGLQWISQLMETPEMIEAGFRINRLPFPACYDYEFGTADYWECYAKHLTLTSYHPGGTCRMGNASSAKSVVDYKLRVHGISGLRVADASIMPNLPSGNPNGAIMMIAEKASAIIRKVYASG